MPLPGGWSLSGSAQFYPAHEVTAGGSTGNFGGTNQGGSTFDDVHTFVGNLRYNTTVDDFASQGLTRTQGLSIPLMPPGALFADRLTQIDISVRKTFTLPNGMRWDVQADVYNLPNYFPIHPDELDLRQRVRRRDADDQPAVPADRDAPALVGCRAGACVTQVA